MHLMYVGVKNSEPLKINEIFAFWPVVSGRIAPIRVANLGKYLLSIP